MTLDHTVKCDFKTGKRIEFGTIFLKGDSITLIQDANAKSKAIQ